MPPINLTISEECFTPKFFPLLMNYENRFECYMGSAGSSKSYFITQKLLIKGLQSKRKIMICRRYGTTIRHSTFALTKEILTEWKIKDKCKIRESDFNIILPNGTEIIFMGLDDEEKLLSIAGITDIFIEEVYEISRSILEQLNLRLRANKPNLQIFMAFNPISDSHWLHEWVNEERSSYLFVHSTFKDNPFLNDAYKNTLMDLYKSNPEKAKIFCDGEWGNNPEGLVYRNWVEQEFEIRDLGNLERRGGMDIGFTDPSALLDTYYDADNKIIYVYNEFYKSGCQLDELAKAFQSLRMLKTKTYCDNADARAIAFFKSANIRVEPCKKGANSVNMRILFLQNHKIIVHPRCVNVIRELRNFSYIKNKSTDQYTDNTTHEFSHALDGLGYAYSDIYTKSTAKTFEKSVLGL